MKRFSRLLTGSLVGAAAGTALMISSRLRARNRARRKMNARNNRWSLIGRDLFSFRRGERELPRAGDGIARQFYTISKDMGRTMAHVIGVGSQLARVGRRWLR